MAVYDRERNVILLNVSDLVSAISPKDKKPDREKWIFNWDEQGGGNKRSWVDPETVRRMGMQTGEPHSIFTPNGRNATVWEGRLGYGIIDPTFVFIGKVRFESGGRKRTEWFYKEFIAPDPAREGYHKWWAAVRSVTQRKNRVAGSKLQELATDALERFKTERWDRMFQ